MNTKNMPENKWVYTVEQNYGRHCVVETDGKTKSRLVAQCLHAVDANRIRDLYANEGRK